MKHKYSKPQSGVTLVELMVTLAILSIVLLGIYSFFLFENKTYNTASAQYDIQSSIRLAVERISKDIRYSRDVEIFKGITTGSFEEWEKKMDVSHNYIYLTPDKKSIKYKKAGESSSITIAGGDKASFILDIKKQGNNKLFLGIGGKNKGRDFKVEFNETILNIHLGAAKEILDSTEGKNVGGIKYK